jgi:hypothetical protein
MKDFYGNSIQKYYETVRSGTLTAVFGAGQVRTNDLTLPKGTYVLTVSCYSDTSVGKQLAVGDFQGRIQTSSGVIIEGSHTGNNGYALSFEVSGVVNFQSETTLYALGQTRTQDAVCGGMKVVLRAVKVN